MAYEPFDLTGKAALVTGGNSGIGFGMAEALARAGAAVAIWGVNPTRNAEAAARLRDLRGGAVHAEICDVADEAAVDAAMARTVDALGRLDSCFANAGVSSRGGDHASFAEMTTAEWHRVTRVNLDGVFFTLRAATRVLRRQGQGGSLVTTGSAFGVLGQPLVQHYAACKAGVESLARSLAAELGRERIRANCVIPGYIDTPMTHARITTDDFTRENLDRQPIGRWGTPADFGGLAVYLASDASAFVTGATFVVDGGLTVTAKVKTA